MIIVGTLLVATSFAAAVLASRPRSAVGKRLAQLAPRAQLPQRLGSVLINRELAESGLGWTAVELVRAKIVLGLVAAAAAAAIALIVPVGFFVVAAAGYAGFIAPTLRVERVAAFRRAEADDAVVALVEWAEALVAIAERGVGGLLIDRAIAAAARSYTLGAPLFGALAREAAAARLSTLALLANDLERARDLGRGALVVLRDHRDRLRASERARSLDAAGRVEGRLMLVLVLCYLPALMLLVVIPLFLGLLDGLFA